MKEKTYNPKRMMKALKVRRKFFFLAAMLLTGGMASAQVVIKGNVYGGCEIGNVSKNTTIEINNGTMKGSVYGGGMGSLDDETQGAVLGNTLVNMKGGTVERSIYGGGELGSVGTFTTFDEVVYPGEGDTPSETVRVPKACQEGTGFVQVLIDGGHVGLSGSTMPHAGSNPDDDDCGWVFAGCQGEADSINYHKANALGVVDSTYLEIKSGVITASVYGGCENGLVLRSTNVKIKGGQIGTGYKGNNDWDGEYTEDQWTAAKNAVTGGTVGTDSYVNPFHECDAWTFVTPYQVYDYYYNSLYIDENGQEQHWLPDNSANVGHNGQSFFGKVFGGGSGFYPIAPGIWRRTAGQVRKDTWVEITGGHILTSVYGGNETTDVLGTTHVKMTGGTLGVPRDSASIARHPVTCYLFGAGMGDPRVLFNTWTNVQNVEVEVSGNAFVFGSVLGGGEEGHVIADVDLTIKGDAHVGTLGYTYLDGNVFGGGRGFSGEALTAGTVGGNIEVNIEGGTMLGSVYGGGRLASVGTHFAYPDSDDYGQFQDGPDHGYVTVNISGGTIGNNHESLEHQDDHSKGCNVFGGSMGRITLMDGTTENPLWPRLAQVKQAKVIIQGESSAPSIEGYVYGGCEYGSVRDSAIVILDNPNATIRKIFGGGYGSVDYTHCNNDSTTALGVNIYPAMLAGRVLGNTLVNVKRGTVQKNVYGGGEYASVGMEKNGVLIGGKTNVIVSGGTIGDNTMYASYNPDVVPVNQEGHVYGGGQGTENDPQENLKPYCNVNYTKVEVSGGKIYGSVFGGGADSHVLGNDTVYIRSNANIGNKGQSSWDGNVFGGGKGYGYLTFTGEGEERDSTFTVYKTMGRVGGNTYINVEGGTLKGSVFGGGRLALTGVDVDGVASFLEGQVYDSTRHGLATIKVSGTTSRSGNDITYSTVIGTDDAEDLLSSDESVGDIFGSGKGDCDYFDDIWAGRTANTSVTVTGSPRIYGGVFGGGEQSGVGYYNTIAADGVDGGKFYEKSGATSVTLGVEGESNHNPVIGTELELTISAEHSAWTLYDTIDNVVTLHHTCTGNVFGGSQGDVQTDKPNWVTMARARTTYVNIHGGTIMSCVHGGAEHGTVLEDTHVNVTGGTIGGVRNSLIAGTTTTGDTYHFGSVFGGGYGSKELEPHDNDSSVIAVDLAGRTYGNTYVNVSGGHVYNNIFGGGDLASVGMNDESRVDGVTMNDSLVDLVPRANTGHCTVNVSGTAYVGDYVPDHMHGFVFGGGKGVGNDAAGDYNLYCNVNSTEVIADLDYSDDDDATNGHIGGSIFGGSPYGHVLDSTYVELQGGVIGTTGFSGDDGHLFGGGWGDKSNFVDDIPNKRYFLASGRVGGHTRVKMTGGQVLGNLYGGGFVALTGVGVDGSFVTYIDTTTDPQEYDSLNHGWTRVEVSGGCVGDTINRGLNLLLSDEKCGNVYGGGRGDSEEHIEDDFGRLANSAAFISGNPLIYGSVYGGGQMANSGHWNNYDLWYTKGTCATLVDIKGSPTIGTEREFDHGYSIGTGDNAPKYTLYDTINGVRMICHTRTGNVYGGGQGDVRLKTAGTWRGHPEGFEQGHCGEAEVRISGTPRILSSVFGGSEQGAVWGDTKVTIAGGTIGKEGIVSDSLKLNNQNQLVVGSNHATYSFGSVYGGSYGLDAYHHMDLSTVPSSDFQQVMDSIYRLAGHVYGNTEVNITGGQVYGNVFGGGDIAIVGDTIGQNVDLTPKPNTGHCEVNVSGSAKIGPLDNTGLNAYVYGGGKGVGEDPNNRYKAYCNVNSAAVTVDLTYDNPDDGWNEETDGRVYGSLFGGGSDAHTLGNVSVTLNGGLIGTEGRTGYDGNIFGGGRNFLRHNYTAGRVGGNTTVEMTDGQVYGSIYGGGRLALTGVDVNGALREGDNSVGKTKVMVKGGTVGNNTQTGNTADPAETVIETFADYSMGSVYGGGKGDINGIVGHPAASALLVAIVKNTEVEISDTLGNHTHVYGIVYGGGEVSNVGDYSYEMSQTQEHGAQIHNIDTVAGTGLAKVTISGGIIGGDRSQMRCDLADPTDPTNYYTKYNDDLGYVYGGGEGISNNPNLFPSVYEGSTEEASTSLINLMGTVMNTQVTITQDTTQTNVISRPLVKGSVFGGSEAGHVRGNTLVTIKGGQIGGDARYLDNQFIDPVTTAITNENALEGTVHWDFGKKYDNDTLYKPFDLVLLKQDTVPSDGKSWFGNVFGGGSGWFPYVENPGTDDAHCSWNPLSGKVWGNTHVVVEGGHILNNVYGGNESTDIGGKTLVEIKGGTVGVPRTKQQIIDLPTIGYVFGGGCGDPRTVFDNLNNVDSTKVVVTGGTIYGSVYGGAEDGHVLGDARVSVSGEAITTNGVTSNSTIIGCKGLSTSDGNIFGGGRNFFGENNKAGRVGGNITVNLAGGCVQGSVFGGGRMALSGVDENGEFPAADWNKHGNVTINVSGVATGSGNNITYSTVIGNADNNGLDLLTLNDESVGDIFGSGKGDTKNYQNILAGRVTNATINVTGSPRIYGSVFGGGEMASLGWWGDDGEFYDNTGSATVTIGSLDANGDPTEDNPVIGTYLELDATYAQDPTEWTIYDDDNYLVHTCTGNVFGGSQGDVDVKDWDLSDESTLNNWPLMGRSREAVVNIYGGTIMAEVYGGSEQGTVTGDTHVTVKGGTIGTSEVATSVSPRGFFGSVVGAGYGSDLDSESLVVIDGDNTRVDEVAGRVYGDVTVDMLGGTVVGDVYGGAAFAYVGEGQSRTDKGNVTVNIGHEDQMDHPDQGPTILGNVFGANYETGTPYGDVEVHVYSTKHNHSTNPNVDNCYPHTVPATADGLADLPANKANFALQAVYGGGDRANYTPLAGKTATVHVYDCDENTINEVYGGCNAAAIGPATNNTSNTSVNTFVIIDGGHINQVFGGGNGTSRAADIHGTATTTINGGLIHGLFGGSNNNGQIDEINLVVNDESECTVLVGDGFGGNNAADVIADVTTTLSCSGDAIAHYANFYGGSRLGNIYGDLTVNVMGGTYTNLFAGSKGQADDPSTTDEDESISADIREITAEFAADHDLPSEMVGHGGNITLNIYGGTIENAFGGSDVLSQIDGRIMVNVIDTVDVCGLDLTNVYGAGRKTAYTPLKKNDKVINSPIVNVIHGEVKGNVYGGGQGATATTIANPEVHIGYVAGNHIMDSLKPIYQSAPRNPLNFDNAQATIGDFTGNSGGDVFGGGHEAAIGDNTYHCNTSVTIGKHNTLVRGSVFGGGYGKILAEGEHIHPADSIYGSVYGNDTVRVLAGHIKGHVYGGGAESPVEGNTWVKLTGGRVGTLTVHKTTDETTGQEIDSIIPGLNIPYYHLEGGRVFGGGRGINPASDAEVAEADTITYSKYANFGRVKGNTYVYVSDTAKIHDCVYGGGALASVGNGHLTDKTSGVATVTISGGEIGPLDGTGLNAYVYGGGRGEEDDEDEHFALYANVDSTSVIVCDSARIYGSIFGGGADGHVLGDATIHVKKSLANNPAHDEIPVIGTNGKTSWDGNIFGGGRNYRFSNLTAGRVGGNIQIDMSDGLLKGNVYGGGRMGLTGMDADGEPISGDEHGLVTINISGGTIGSPCDTLTIGNVFGGGKGGVEYYVEYGGVSYLNMILGHAKYGRVKETKVNITGDARVYGSVFGGGEIGKIMGNTTVKVSGGLIGSELSLDDDSDRVRYHGSVYGGGRGYEGEYSLDLPGTGEVVGNSMVNIEGGQVLENVFGGGEIASIIGNAHVNISGGQIGVEQQGQAEVIGGYVYGGGMGRPGIEYIDHANVDSTKVNISGGYIVNTVFGGGNDGHVLKSTSINMTGGTVGKKITLAEMITDSLETVSTYIYSGSVIGGGRGTTPIDDAGNYDSNDITGRVFGNAHVTISGGTVRHAVYGGGGLSSVGTYTLGSDGLPVFTEGTGKTYVTIDGNALIGPTIEDLTQPTAAELTSAMTGYDTDITQQQYIDTVFKYLGGNEGWAFGAGCGLIGQTNLTYCDSAFLNVSGNAQIVGSVYGGGENAHVKSATKVDISGGTIGGLPLHDAGSYTIPGTGEYAGVSVALAAKDSETREDVYSAGRYVFRGNVYGGGKGTERFASGPDQGKYSMTAGRVYGNTNVTVSGGTIYNRVYGGGSLASVGTFTYHGGTIPADIPLTDSLQRISYTAGTGITTVNVSGGTIGSNGRNNGDVVGGGRGIAGNPGNYHAEFGNSDPADQVVRLAYVGSTNVNIHHGSNIKSNVYGGSINGHVYSDTYVTVDGGTIGSADNTGWHSNVYGGGGGLSRYKKSNGDLHLSITSGRVYGNTTVTIESSSANENTYKPTIYGNVFSGGAIASVGSYDLRTGHESIPVAPNTGITNVTVTSGTIGTTGDGNGNVYGSGRGWPDAPLAYLDTLSYVVESNVSIGKDNNGTYEGDALVKGSVYGSGENGHLYKQANVKVYSGTVEHSVFGAGEGSEHYMLNGKQRYNPMAGVVQGNTDVKVYGGLIKENVYGGGRLASVGIVMAVEEGLPVVNFIPDQDENNTFGYTNVEVTGGTIGDADVVQYLDDEHPIRHGNVFGASMGMLLDTTINRKWEYLANVKATHVRIGDDDESNSSTATVLSSVYGGSEVGIVRDSTYVQIQKGAVIGAELETLALHRGNVFAGGCGNDSITYPADDHHDQNVTMYVRKAGAVMRNARLEMTGGTVYGNLYGGCETTDVGTYNYSQSGPAQCISGGKATVIMRGGQLGWQRSQEQINNRPFYGYVYGSGKGNPALGFNTWTNVNNANVEISGGTIYGSVLGGGEEGHVMNNTHVVVKGSETHIGTYGYTHYDGNVFGAGRGRTPVALTAGSIGGNTLVEIQGGTILGSIFGGGNNGSVGIHLVPHTHADYGEMQEGVGHGYTTVNVSGGTIGHEVTPEIPDPRTGGNVYGGGRGLAGAPGTVYQKLAKVKQTEVNITEAEGKPTFIMGSVFGSGEDGHVLQDTYVNVYGGQIGGDTYQASIDDVESCGNIYHGNVYGGGRGVDTYTDNEGHQVHSITAGKVERNTYVNIYGGRITRNVYGGGNLSSVGDAAYDTTGHANVNIVGGYIGTSVNEDDYHGNVFGGGHGGILGEYINLAYVKYTHVTVDSTARIFGSVFGGGEDGHVRKNAVVDMKGGIVGKNADTDKLHGNVYGGGRGIIQKHGQVSPTAGEVFGHTTVNLMKSDKKHDGIAYTPEIYNNVYGGGSRSVVGEYKVVNIAAGLVHDNVFGGSRDIPPKRSNKAPRWVNMWGGKVEGAIYGCSHNSIDSVGNGAKDKWASFINLSGGSVNNIFGAGYGGDIEGILHDTVRGGIVRGSVAVLIGKNAIENANKTVIGEADSLVYKINNQIPQDSLIIRGNVFAGSDLVNDSTWGKYAVTGYSHIYIDGTGYNTTDGPTATNYMSIAGGVYGSSSNCEAGKEGHSILVRNYGTRGTGDEFSVYRKLATIQRCDTLLLDHSNLNLSGANDITNADVNGDNPRKKYGVLKVDNAMMVANGSGLVLGASQQAVYIDSVMQVRSLYWNGGEGSSVYQHAAVHNNSNWEWIGIKDSDNKLYRIPASGDPVQLTAAQENVIRFNNMSKMWVRTHEKMNNSLGVARDTSVYGELQGFFRLRADSYDPHGNESFAYARPKFTSPDRSEPDENTSDGGFLSYRDSHNFFTDGGANYTKTKQYPYINEGVPYPEDPVRGNFSDWRRKWVYPQNGHIWYVDGTRGWGRDILRSDDPNAGRYPDKPKKTITGQTAGGVGSGVISDTHTGKFSYFKDHIYVVGALSALDEVGPLCDSVGADGTHYPLRLYRYPGGHVMSNTKPDYGGGEATSGVNFVNVGESNAGPGANYGALLNVQGNDESAGASITLRGVLMDGLNGYSPMEVESHNIPTEAPFTVYDSTQVSMPLVLTHKNATLTLEGGTELMRGYNKTNAKDWYYNADYRAPSGAASLSVYHGGAIFVDSLATVNVNGKVSITGNTQNLNGTPVESNVYLPTFNKSLNITGTLHDNTSIGVTSPKRNKEKSYYDNTFSPVAVAGDKTYASSAWTNNNFLDDQDWFFGRNNKNTYYFDGEGSILDAKTVYFGWTWANVVRKQPAGYTGNGSNITISSEEGMAWLISKSVGMNGEIATDFSNVNISQTADLDMKQYVWVPLGYESKPFKGTYDGRGHLIDSLVIEYLGKNDMRYQRNDYGMFGYVNNGTVKRTFVVGGKMSPASIPDNRDEAVTYYIGGLVGQLEGVYAEVSNSEAANVIICPNYSSEHDVVAGGLVGQMTNGHIHSSMVISTIEMGALVQGPVGGLVGSATAGDIYNSFANVKFNVTGGSDIKTIGGLLGDNTGAKMSNCYLALDNTSVLSSTNFGSIVYSNTTSSNIDSCYVTQNAYSMAREGGCHSSCHQYTSVIGSDNLGYMYADNKVMDITSRTDSTLFQLLNKWVSKKGIQYGHWARPGLSEINSDLPVLLLCDMSVTNVESTDDFRSLATYNKGKALQYGGTARDGSDKHLSEMLKRDEYVFVYGDIDGHDSAGLETPFDGDGALATVTINADKVSIYEHASIKYPGKLADLIDTYVGITFDNSFGQATATPGVNVGLVGPDGYSLPRDWHMFSSPLNNAPLGFNYIVGENNTNTNTYTSGNQGTYYNNIWMNQAAEFSWLTQLGSDECVSGAGNRYWMKTFDANDQKTDGYFPTRRGSLFADHLDDLFVVGSDECPSSGKYRYPYGMDFYTWNEPVYHWINFKRNGPNHWNSENPHEHLDYVPVYGATPNQNEEKLIVGRGYMAAITTASFMQSHGNLNDNSQSIMLTNTPSSLLKGWNLVGNPYHGYLDFDLVASGDNLTVLSDQNYLSENADEGVFYVVYNADKYSNRDASTAFRYYPVRGSEGGDYAEQYLHPHQGFYVKAKAAGNLTFNESMLVSRETVDGNSHFRADRPAYPLVNLYLSSDQGCADVTVIEFERPEWGGATKLKELRVGDGVFYAQHDNTHYAALFAKAGIDRVPVWFEAKEDDIFTLKWNLANADFHSMYLIDNKTGVQYDMLRNNTYSFEGHKGDYPSRFLIVFSLTDVDEHLEGDGFVFFDGSQWMVTGEGDLEFIDVQGQVLLRTHVNDGQSRVAVPDVAPGVYLFRLTNSSNTRVQKVIVKR